MVAFVETHFAWSIFTILYQTTSGYELGLRIMCMAGALFLYFSSIPWPREAFADSHSVDMILWFAFNFDNHVSELHIIFASWSFDLAWNVLLVDHLSR